MKKILLFGKNSDQLYANLQKLQGHPVGGSIAPSPEVDIMTRVLVENGWGCYWTCISFFHSENEMRYCDPSQGKMFTLQLQDLSSTFDVIVFRVLGSVDSNLKEISRVISLLEKHFGGLLINHPETMKYGLRKDYLLDLQSAGFPVISSTYLKNDIPFSDIINKISNEGLKKHLIKSVTGELGVSIAVIQDTEKIFDVPNSREENGEAYLRRKQEKVGGWLLQPIIEEIWQGEYQLIYFGDTLSHGFYKSYERGEENMMVPSQKYRNWQVYEPSIFETTIALNIKKYLQEKLSKPTHLFRMDFIKISESEIKILEFELFNPGILLLDPNQENVDIEIVKNFERELVKQLSQ